jgi:uncharacterized protein (TIGR03118 family)
MEDVPMRRLLVLAAALGLALTAAVPAVADSPHSAYDTHVLVSDGGLPADRVDPNLVNAWGLTRTGGSPWWVADNGTNVSTLYNGAGVPQFQPTPLVVSVPGAPTGTVANTTPGFMIPAVIPAGATSGTRANFLFDTEGGQILGWSPSVAPTTAVLGLDRSNVGAIYKGLAIALVGTVPHLYATDFHNARVDMITPSPDPNATTWVVSDSAFVDPGLPAGYAPFGIQNIDGTIFVTYAKQDAAAEDEIAGDGLGFVDAFDVEGSFQGRVASGDALNAPWGLAKAPDDFGEFSGQLLVGNFGDGRINAFRFDGWEPDGHLKLANHRPLTIDGLWAIAFGGDNLNSGPSTTLFFTAGPADESHGAFGTVTVH